MTQAARHLHPREEQFLKTLETLDILTKRDALTTRANFLRMPRSHDSLLGMLRERGLPETQLAQALTHMGIPQGGDDAVDDPLHPLHIADLRPYQPPNDSALPNRGQSSLTFERLADALMSLGVPLTDEQYNTPDIEKQLLARHIIDDVMLTKAYALWKGLRFIDIRRSPPDPALKNKFSENIITTQMAIPHSIEHGTLLVSVPDPMTIFLRNMIEDETGERPILVLTPLSQIQAYIDETYERDRVFAALKSESSEREETRRSRTTQNSTDSSEETSAVSTFVDTMIREAAVKNASDIHIEPTPGETIIRMRIDGELEVYKLIPRNMHRNLVNRIRAMGELNTSGERQPQDAVIRYRERGAAFNLRCNIVPAINGGNVALRLTRPPESIRALEHTDLSDLNLEHAEWALGNTNGMIITSGPTGSGKTEFAHSLIKRLNTPHISIYTIENPVEIEIPGLIQIQIAPNVPNEDMRTDYPDILRALLRQDPDVIMVGEVRDLITARTAVQAAQTGHLLISTVHTNSAAGVIARLMDMGIETFNLAASLRLLIAQRLAGRPCTDCRVTLPTPPGLFDRLGGGPATMIETTGTLAGSHAEHAPKCPTCRGSGMSGRIGIHEMIRVTPNIEQAIRNRLSEREIENYARKEGFRNLWEDGLLKIIAGQTTLRLLSAKVDAPTPASAPLAHA